MPYLARTRQPRGFPGSSAGKESTCDAGDPGLIPGSGSSPGEGISYLLQYSCLSVVAQTVKNSPVMWEIWVQSLGWKDPLEEGMAKHSAFLPGESPWKENPHGKRSLAGYSPWGPKQSDRTKRLSTASMV